MENSQVTYKKNWIMKTVSVAKIWKHHGRNRKYNSGISRPGN